MPSYVDATAAMRDLVGLLLSRVEVGRVEMSRLSNGHLWERRLAITREPPSPIIWVDLLAGSGEEIASIGLWAEPDLYQTRDNPLRALWDLLEARSVSELVESQLEKIEAELRNS